MSNTRHGTRPRRRQSPSPVTRKPAAVKPLTGEVVTMPRRVGRQLLLAGRLASVALVPAALAAPALSHADVTTSGEPEASPIPARLAANLTTGSAVGTSGFFAVPGTPYGFFLSGSTDPSGKYGAILQGGVGLAYGWSFSPLGLTTPATTVPVGSSDWGVGGGLVGILQTQNSGVTIKYNAVDGSGGIIFGQDFKSLVNPATGAAVTSAAAAADGTTTSLATTATASSPLFTYGGSGTLAFGYSPSTDTLSVTPGMSGWISSPTQVQGFVGLFGALGVPRSVTNGSWIAGSADAATPEGSAALGQGASPLGLQGLLDSPTAASAVVQAQQPSGTPSIIIGTVPGVTVPYYGFFGPTIDGKIADAVSNAYDTVKGWLASPDQGQVPQVAPSDGTASSGSAFAPQVYASPGDLGLPVAPAPAGLAGTQPTASDRVANAFSDLGSSPSAAETYSTLMAMANLGNGPSSPVTVATSVQGPTGQAQDWAPQQASPWPDGTPVQQYSSVDQSLPQGQLQAGGSDTLNTGGDGVPAAPVTTAPATATAGADAPVDAGSTATSTYASTMDDSAGLAG